MFNQLKMTATLNIEHWLTKDNQAYLMHTYKENKQKHFVKPQLKLKACNRDTKRWGVATDWSKCKLSLP